MRHDQLREPAAAAFLWVPDAALYAIDVSFPELKDNANGAEMLAIRIEELSAITRLGQWSKTGVFADALAASAMKTGAAVSKAVACPDPPRDCRRC